MLRPYGHIRLQQSLGYPANSTLVTNGKPLAT
jgi:hypothetical protein